MSAGSMGNLPAPGDGNDLLAFLDDSSEDDYESDDESDDEMDWADYEEYINQELEGPWWNGVLPEPHPTVLIAPTTALAARTALGQDDPRRMTLTKDEWHLAMIVKRLTGRCPARENLSDFMCAQLALVCQDDAVLFEQEVMTRASGLEEFRKEFLITDTLEEGCRAVEELVELFPTFLLYFGFSEEDGTHVYSVLPTAFDASRLRNCEREYRKFGRGLYYFCHALAPDLESIRKGAIGLIDAKDVDWDMKRNMETLGEILEPLFSFYPERSEVRLFHTGVFVNMMTSLAKKYLPRDTRDRVSTGHTFDGSLRDILVVPTVEACKQRLISETQRALRRRYANESSFQLHC